MQYVINSLPPGPSYIVHQSPQKVFLRSGRTIPICLWAYTCAYLSMEKRFNFCVWKLTGSVGG